MPYEWSASGDQLNWSFSVRECPNRIELEFIEATLNMAIFVLRRGMEKAEASRHGATFFDVEEVAHE